LKRKLSHFILAMIPLALLPPIVGGQVTHPTETVPAEPAEKVYHYELTAGYGYTSLNQLNQSRSGLQGVELSATRDWGKYFGAIADGAYYKYPIKSGNPGSPAVDFVAFGPVLHAEIYGRVGGFVRVLLGGEHTAGNGTVPNISFAGGVGGGMEYRLSPRLSLRASGDDIYSSFVQDPEHLGYSPHRRGNGRASLSAVYRF